MNEASTIESDVDRPADDHPGTKGDSDMEIDMGSAMDIDAAMDEVLARRPEASALACVDAGSGLVLASAARNPAAMEALASSAVATSMIATTPPLEGPSSCGERSTQRAMVVSREWVQVHERVPGRPALFVVGIADAGANIGLLASCVRDVSVLLGTHP